MIDIQLYQAVKHILIALPGAHWYGLQNKSLYLRLILIQHNFKNGQNTRHRKVFQF